jgi:hypothetical protein
VPTGGEHNFTENGTVLSWQNISSLGWLIGGTEQMRLTSTGLGIGTSSPAGRTHINLTATNTPGLIVTNDSFTGSYNAGRIRLGSYTAGTYGADIYAIQTSFADDMGLGFATFPASGSVPVERARITSGGYGKFSNTGTYNDATGAYHEMRSDSNNNGVARFDHTTASTPYGLSINFTAASPDNNTSWFLLAQDSTTARCYIYSDGDLANHDGVYGTISDERLKQDIVDAPSQWDDLKAVRFRKYRMKTDVAANPDAPALLGVVAQELEQTSPGLIDEHPNEDGTTTKTVKSSILLMKAAVALQEAMARIEQLEAKFAALESK